MTTVRPAIFSFSSISGWILMMLILLLRTGSLMADARTDYLVNLLQTGGSYRVKVQAAQTLGSLKEKAAIPALMEALADSSVPVVVAAAAALAEIGDSSALPELQKLRNRTTNATVRKQVVASIRLLESVARVDEKKSASAGCQYLVKVDSMGNASSSNRVDIPAILKNEVLQFFSAQDLVMLQEDGMTTAQVRQKLSRDRLKGFIVSGAITRMEMETGHIVVGISLNVFSNPDYSLLMTPSAEIRVPLGAADSRQENRKKTEEMAIRRLVENLVGKILEAVPGVL